MRTCEALSCWLARAKGDTDAGPPGTPAPKPPRGGAFQMLPPAIDEVVEGPLRWRTSEWSVRMVCDDVRPVPRETDAGGTGDVVGCGERE